MNRVDIVIMTGWLPTRSAMIFWIHGSGYPLTLFNRTGESVDASNSL